MADPRVIVNGQDLWAEGYVSSIARISEKKTFKKDKLITNTYSFTVNNADDAFSVNNPDSLFADSFWLYDPIQIYDRDEERIWNGVITQIDRNHNTKTAIVKTKNLMFKYRNARVVYTSSTWETPGEAVKNICDAVGFTGYNEAALNTSIARYTDASCKLKCDFSEEDNVSLQAALEKLADYGNADAYNHQGEFYYVHWVPFTGGVSVSIDTTVRDAVRSLPQVTEQETDLINDYSIGYDGDLGTPATDANQSNIGAVSRARYGAHSLPEMRSGDDAQIVYENATSAAYIGNGYITRTHRDLSTDPRPLSKTRFNLPADNDEWVDLQSYFRLTLPDEAWTLRIFEVFEFTINEDADNIEIVAYEVVE